jgi:hypothetical protein
MREAGKHRKKRPGSAPPGQTIPAFRAGFGASHGVTFSMIIYFQIKQWQCFQANYELRAA